MSIALLRPVSRFAVRHARQASTFNIDLAGKTAFVAGVADRYLITLPLEHCEKACLCAPDPLSGPVAKDLHTLLMNAEVFFVYFHSKRKLFACSRGYGWAIAKNLAQAGCKVLVGTWPVVLGVSANCRPQPLLLFLCFVHFYRTK
jgi:hypothetical protein